ncbi:MAG TPA: hypothetical protein PK096_00870 [Candidatus Saccharibacteria bacterium]|nr:hypothetical protein [Candidatus Saccharibacteria bacterium]HRK93906.1 hypothetical protein [Candidatus Saccharibacteria bacterium]
MKTRAVRSFAGRFLVSVAYLVCTLQWLWLVIIGLPPLIESGILNDFMQINPNQAEQPNRQADDLPPIVVAVVGIVTLVMIVVTIFIMLKLPKAVADTGESVVKVTTRAVLPAVTHHRKLSAKKKRVISRQVMFAVQIGLCVLPAGVALFVPTPDELPKNSVALVALTLLATSVTGFGLGWLIEPQAVKKKRKAA